MIVAVTGASGHVGANLVRTLVAEGHAVRALVHEDGRPLAGVPLEQVRGDVRDRGSLERAFAGAEVVYHLAARISIDGDQGGQVDAVNALGTRNVVSACLRAGVRRLVHFSSIHALSPFPLDQPVDETRPLNDGPEALAYERSKVEGERAVLAGIAEGLDAVIVNPTAIIGPNDFGPSAMGSVLLDLYHRRLPALVDGGFDWVDVRDVVAGALAAQRKGRTGERYLLAGRWLSFPDLAALVGELTGVRIPAFTSPMWLARLGAHFTGLYSHLMRRPSRFTGESLQALVQWREVRSDKARRELGYTPRPLAETLTDTYAWYCQAGLIPAVRVSAR